MQRNCYIRALSQNSYNNFDFGDKDLLYGAEISDHSKFVKESNNLAIRQQQQIYSGNYISNFI